MAGRERAAGAGKGFSGRLTKGAGTHLASWLQASTALSATEAQALLDADECSAKVRVVV